MNQVKVIPIRDNEKSRQEIRDGLAEYNRLQREKRIRDSVARDIADWDESWGGPNPHKTTSVTDEQRRQLHMMPLERSHKKSFYDTNLFLFIVVVLFFTVLICAGNLLADAVDNWHPLTQLLGWF